ncbi:tetratricopeptide repeat protein [Streptomyces sp. NPDC059568]|uniref:tetratricopeptide repeat protein n=1 Tax=Streptomyces sp. NPDC059568 TaxID=3346868 RepID=UPI0036BEBE42
MGTSWDGAPEAETERERPGSVGNSVSGGAVVGNVVQTGSIGSFYLGDGGHAGGLPAPDDWPRPDELLPFDFGVRMSRTFRDEPDLTPYVERDHDVRLANLLWDGAESGGLVVVTGERLSGKTRTAYEALSQGLGRRGRVFAPSPGTDLRTLPALLRGRSDGPYVLWLDDLEGHLGGHGLTPGLLAQLIQQRVIVLATMSEKEYEKHRFGSSASSRVLVRAETVELSSRWSEDELSRLMKLSSHDARLEDAVEWRGDSSVTEYLAIGPELWAEWQHARRPSAHPRGHLLVRAAIDLARHGIKDAVPLELLRVIHQLYISGSADASREPFEDALAWATETRYGVTGLLVAGPEPGTWRAYGSLVADGTRSPDRGRMPHLAWHYVVTVLKFRAPGDDVVLAAARAALLPEAEKGDADAMMWLALFCDQVDDTAEAARWYRAAADADPSHAHFAGKYLSRQGNALEAIPYLRTAADAGDRPSATLLGRLLRDEAEHWLRISAQSGDGEAAYELANLLHRSGTPVQEADKWYAKAAELGYAPAPDGLQARPDTVNR